MTIKQHLVAISEISCGELKQAVRITHCHKPADVGVSYAHWVTFVKNMGGIISPPFRFLQAEAKLGPISFDWECFELDEYEEILEIKKPIIYEGKTYNYDNFQFFIWSRLKKNLIEVEE